MVLKLLEKTVLCKDQTFATRFLGKTPPASYNHPSDRPKLVIAPWRRFSENLSSRRKTGLLKLCNPVNVAEKHNICLNGQKEFSLSQKWQKCYNQ